MSKTRKRSSMAGDKVFYRCHNFHGGQCQISIYLLYNADSDVVTLWKKEMEDDHSKSTQKVSEDTLIKISELFKSWIVKPKEIVYALRKNYITEPSITNYLKMFRDHKYGPSTIDLNQLKQWFRDKRIFQKIRINYLLLSLILELMKKLALY